jgi:hypothetical protein
MAKKPRIALDLDAGIIRVNDTEIDIEVLLAIAEPKSRVLWGFIEEDGRVQAVPYDEKQVIWIQPRDLEREEAPAENWGV